MTDARALTKALGGRWWRGYGSAPCPVCQPERRKGQNALTLKDGRDRLLAHCKKSDCGFRDILAAAGVSPGEYRAADPSILAQRETEERADREKRVRQAERFKAITPTPVGTFQCWIGGYSHGQDIGEIWRFQIDNGALGDAVCEADTNITSTISWGGAPEAINRLVLGYSQELGSALRANGMEPEKVPAAIQEIGRHTQASLVNPAMPAADAIDLARFLAETTKQFVRFLPGSNSVGGNIDIATITKHENFKWVTRKHYYPPSLNPLRTDHA